MKTEKPIVHFGCGALGRGLVMPLLYQSQKTLAAIDTNEKILDQIRKMVDTICRFQTEKIQENMWKSGKRYLLLHSRKKSLKL